VGFSFFLCRVGSVRRTGCISLLIPSFDFRGSFDLVHLLRTCFHVVSSEKINGSALLDSPSFVPSFLPLLFVSLVCYFLFEVVVTSIASDLP